MNQSVHIRWTDFAEHQQWTGVSLSDAKKLAAAVGSDAVVNFEFKYVKLGRTTIRQASIDMRTVRMITYGPEIS